MDWEGFFTNYKRPGFIPGYDIVNKLGSGVFGEVYKAKKSSIGKFYAIKFLKITDDRVSEAIFKELESLAHFAQLDHPNLVTIEDRGEVMGIPFVVMGYAGDETLKKRLESETRISHGAVLEIFRQICAGTAALHEKSIIHFDLKPANIFLKGNHARVGDYGLSKLVSESHKSMSMGRGTPYYMAPEMLMKTGDHRSDIYSLGVILYQMVSGKVPFVGENDWAVLKQHESAPVQIPGDVDPLFREVISRCLEKRPEARYSSVKEIIAVLDGRPFTASPAPVPMVPPGAVASRPGSGVHGPVAPPVFPFAGSPLPAGRNNNQTLRVHLRDLIDKTSRNPRAAEARYRYQKALEEVRRTPPPLPSQPAADLDSFYTDFDQLGVEPTDLRGTPYPGSAAEADHVCGPAEEIAPPIQMPEKSAKKRGAGFYIATFPYWILHFALFLPLKWLGIGLWKSGGLFARGVAEFFRNFLRYAIVVALTVGLVFLIRFAILGLEY